MANKYDKDTVKEIVDFAYDLTRNADREMRQTIFLTAIELRTKEENKPPA